MRTPHRPKLAAERTNYNLLGQVTSTEAGTAFSGANVTAWTTREARTYTPTGQLATSTLDPGSAPHINAVTANAYDGLDRLLTVTDPVGRVTFNDYDAAGQLERIVRAYGTALQQDYATYAYTPNGQRDWVEDANGNRSDYVYDGFDRLCRLFFPQQAIGAHAANAPAVTPPAVLSCATPAAHATFDYEEYGYDPSGNRTSLTLRSGETIAHEYDNLNREIFRDIPGGTATDVNTGYDLAGRRRFARFSTDDTLNSLCTVTTFDGIDYCYNSAGQLTDEMSYGRRLQFAYEDKINRTRVTYPEGFYAQYVYDAMNRVDIVRENGTTVLADYAYDNLGRRDGLTRGAGPGTDYGYDTASRLSALDHDLDGGSTANDQQFDFAYTAASQLQQRVTSNDAYAWLGSNFTRSYERNGLNQYTVVGGVTYAYTDGDGQRGDLTSDGARTFDYDLENRLISVNASQFTLAYDPLGRLRETNASGSITQFIYDGDRLMAEYDPANGNLLRRYVHGPGVDEPLVAYQRQTDGVYDRRWLVTDRQGSVIAESNASATSRYSYGPYGEPNTWTGERFRYTGQIMLPEVGLYHYKARAFDPVLGRFLQTDPIGYEDDLNLYAYVGNDPLNKVDPSGRLAFLIPIGVCVANPACRAGVGAAIGGAAGLAFSTARELADGKPGVNGADVLGDTLRGATIGAVGGATLSPHATAATAAVLEAADRGTAVAANGGSPGQVLNESLRAGANAATESYVGGAIGGSVARTFPTNEAVGAVAGGVVGPAIGDATDSAADAASQGMVDAERSRHQAVGDFVDLVQRGCVAANRGLHRMRTPRRALRGCR